MLGLWIDSLTDADRDAIIEHPDPTYGGENWQRDLDGCGCLVGSVVMRRAEPGIWPSPWASWGELSDAERYRWDDVGCRFPKLTERFGPERVWRACKLRAAKGNRVDLGTTVSVGGAR